MFIAWSRFALFVSLVGVLAIPFDPPASPPPCDVVLDPVFCIRITDIEKEVGEDTFRFELEFLNWTNQPAAGIVISLNTGDGDPGVPPGAPHFKDAFIDSNGRPIGPGFNKPDGNQTTNNDWVVLSQTTTQIQFGAGTPIMGASAGGFFGLLDPAFSVASQATCISALTTMIPDATDMGGSPPHIGVSDAETIDNGPNVLDGFVIEVTDVQADEQFSINWHLVNAAGDSIGIFASGGVILGDEYGFGTLNLARFVGAAPKALFGANTGYDPPLDTDPDADLPRFWAEDEVAGIDMYEVNPIPAGEEGAGTYFGVEPGAAVTAEFANDVTDNSFLWNGQVLKSGANICPPGGILDEIVSALTSATSGLTAGFARLVSSGPGSPSTGPSPSTPADFCD